MSATGVDASRYTEGRDRYVHFAEDVLDLQLSREQKRVLRAVAEHERVVIMSGNGVGKSFAVAVAKLAFVATNLNSTVLGTSGSYSQYIDAVWRPLKTLHREAQSRVGLPGETYDGGQPTLEIDSDWFAKVVSPRDPGDLEGRHADAVLVLIEEADKAYITDEHFDSAGSSITDDNDRMIAICNPPRDESNAVAKRLESDRWHTIQFSTLDSHNVRVDAGEVQADKITGLTDLDTVVADWRAWNDEEWPGLEQARRWSDPASPQFRDDLDERWYRRRAGVIPPAGAAAHRPFTVEDVNEAWERTGAASSDAPDASAVDAARSGDRTAAASVHAETLSIHYAEQGTNHVEQAEVLTSGTGSFPGFGDWPDHPIAVDAVGEGSALADMLRERFPDVVRFNAGGTPEAETEFHDCWAEGLFHLGKFLRNGGSIDDRELREELLVAARTLEYEERHMASRGRSGSEILQLTSKRKLKERLGHSPDLLDAAYMAVWARDSGVTSGIPTASVSLDEDEADDGEETFEDSAVGQALQSIDRQRRGSFR